MTNQPSPLRYAVLHHEGVSEPHFDLLFELSPGSLLAAWRSPQWPLHTSQELIRLPDHRRLYLDYEGPISGNRGHVTRVAQGTHQIEQMGSALWIIRLDGNRILRLSVPQDGTDRWPADSGRVL